MGEAEFISDLLLAMQSLFGLPAPKAVLDKACKDYDDAFPSRKTHEKRFRETIDSIAAIFGDRLRDSEFSAIRLLYPYSVPSTKYGAPKMKVARKPFKVSDHAKMSIALGIDDLLAKIKQGEA